MAKGNKNRIAKGSASVKGSHMKKPFCPVHKFKVGEKGITNCMAIQHYCATCKGYVDRTANRMCPQCQADLTTARSGRCNEPLELVNSK